MPTRVEGDEEVVGVGKWIVPWSSRRARPDGVCRMFGSGFVVLGAGWSGRG